MSMYYAEPGATRYDKHGQVHTANICSNMGYISHSPKTILAVLYLTRSTLQTTLNSKRRLQRGHESEVVVGVDG